MSAPYCPLPGHDQRRAWVSSDRTDIRKTFEEHAPILVCGIGEIRDDYETTGQTDYLERAGAFRG